MATKNYLMSIAYDGRDFSGYQYQEGLRTVQGEVEAVLEHIFKHPISSKASGRTDAGVHALDQVMAFEARDIMELDRLAYVVTRFLPRDIKLNWIKYSEIHPRFDALAKAYRYRLSFKDELFKRPYSLYIKKKLDIDAMKEAAQALEGTKDFFNFSNRRTGEGSTVRTIYRIVFIESKEGLDLIFIGDGFLYKMVRIMVEYLINVGLDKYPASRTSEVIKKKDRLETRQVAASEALFLERVFYDSHELNEYLDHLQI